MDFIYLDIPSGLNEDNIGVRQCSYAYDCPCLYYVQTDGL